MRCSGGWGESVERVRWGGEMVRCSGGWGDERVTWSGEKVKGQMLDVFAGVK